MATKAERAAAQFAEAQRVQNLERAQAQQAAAKTALETAQVGARGTTGQTIFEKTLAGLPSGLDAGAARGLAAMSARYGLQGATLNAYTGENIGYNIAEQTKAEQNAVDIANQLVQSYSTPVQIPEPEPTKNIAYSTMEEILKSYGITGLASVLEEIRLEYPEASSADIMTLLQFDSRYNKKFNERFSANAARQAAGLTILSPATYLAMEQGYKEIFNKYNLADFNTQTYYDKLIAADVKVTDVNDRVILAFDRVLNDTQTTNAFKKFYPSLNTVNIVTAMLDPVNQLPALQRKVKAAEIGGAALRQNLLTSEGAAVETQQNVPFTNVTRATLGADVLGQEGITKAQAEAGYSKIATELPTAEKLSSIYSGRLGQYGMLEAEQDVFRGLASARRAKERLVSTEIAAFGGTAGTTQGSLKKKSLGQI